MGNVLPTVATVMTVGFQPNCDYVRSQVDTNIFWAEDFTIKSVPIPYMVLSRLEDGDLVFSQSDACSEVRLCKISNLRENLVTWFSFRDGNDTYFIGGAPQNDSDAPKPVGEVVFNITNALKDPRYQFRILSVEANHKIVFIYQNETFYLHKSETSPEFSRIDSTRFEIRPWNSNHPNVC